MATTEVKEYYSGQGKVSLAPFVGGVVKKHKRRWIGNVPNLEISTEVSTEEHKESHSGLRAVDRQRETERKVSFKCTMEDFASANLALAFQASMTTLPKGNVAELVSPEDLVKGDIWSLGKIKVSEVVITDSTTTSPKTLQAGVHYALNEQFGTVEILDVSGVKLPFKAAFNHESADVLGLMKERVDGYYLVFEGLNTAESNAPVLVEIHKAVISPAQTLALINDELASFELEGTALLHNGDWVTVTK